MKRIKQISLCILLLLLLTALPGCKNEAADSDSETLASGPGVPTTNAAITPGGMSSDEITPGGIGTPESYPFGTYANNLEVLKTGTYIMYDEMEMHYPEFTYTVKHVQAEDGANYLWESEGDIPLNGYLHSRLLTADGTNYNINDAEKYYYSMPDYGDDEDYEDDEDEDEDEMSCLFGDDPPSATGEETFGGFVRKYKEYPGEGGATRFYFDNKGNWVGQHGYGTAPGPTGEPVPFEYFRYIKSISPVVPASTFAPPLNYENRN